MKYDPRDTSFLMNVTSVKDIYFLLCVCMYMYTHITRVYFSKILLC